MTTKTITITNPTRSRKWGWGWTNTPTGRNAYSIEIPSKPDYTGTLKQVFAEIASDRTYASMKSGGTLTNSAWFYDGMRIVDRDFRERLDLALAFDEPLTVTVTEANGDADEIASSAASALGRMTSPAKAAAARANGNKPPAPGKKRGRPRKTE